LFLLLFRFSFVSRFCFTKKEKKHYEANFILRKIASESLVGLLGTGTLSVAGKRPEKKTLCPPNFLFFIFYSLLLLDDRLTKDKIKKKWMI
jgi:hypothetical protein